MILRLNVVESAVDSRQSAVDSRQWTVGSEQSAVGSDKGIGEIGGLI
jgi:hypothetical protein